MFTLLLKLLSKIFLFTGLVGGKNSFAKPLKPEEEVKLFEKLKDGDKVAENLLVKHNLRLVAYFAKKYSNYTDQEELISIGSLGLLKAVRTFDYKKGNNFSTYAGRCIENEILMFFRAEKKRLQDVSLDETVSLDKEGNGLTFNEIINEPEEQNVSNIVEKKVLTDRILRIINTCLDQREKEVMCYRYGIDGNYEHTQRETAKIMGISRSYVSRIEKVAIDKIKSEVASSR